MLKGKPPAGFVRNLDVLPCAPESIVAMIVDRVAQHATEVVLPLILHTDAGAGPSLIVVVQIEVAVGSRGLMQTEDAAQVPLRLDGGPERAVATHVNALQGHRGIE